MKGEGGGQKKKPSQNKKMMRMCSFPRLSCYYIPAARYNVSSADPHIFQRRIDDETKWGWDENFGKHFMLIHVVKVFKLKINHMCKLYISGFVLFITLFFFDLF